jgi:hypothetical protein
MFRKVSKKVTYGIITTLVLAAILPFSVNSIMAADEDDKYKDIPLEKRKYLGENDQQLKDARSGIYKKAPKNPNYRPLADTEAPFPTGIQENREAPPGYKGITVTNIWQGKLEGKLLAVYAGRSWEDPQQGLLVIYSIKQNMAPISVNEYKTPTKSGTIKIVKESNDKLVLESENGTTFTFDIKTNTFVDN